MVWVHFLKRFSYKPKLQVTIDYEADTWANVPSRCATAAVLSGNAVEGEPPERKAAAQVKVRPKKPDE